mgnify:FL=1
MLKNDSLPHALLFVGADHVGKTTVAHALIREVMGIRGLARLAHRATPEGGRATAEGTLASHPDYVELKRETDEKTGKRKSNISIKQVREVVGRLSMSSMAGGYKAVFIEEAHRLSKGGVNALLKTLEEPRGKMLFVLRAPSADAVPATIASRCQTLRFSIASREEIVQGLVRTGMSPSDATEAASRAMCRPGLAMRFIKDGDYRARIETREAQADEFFNASLPRRLSMVMELIPKGEGDAASELKHIVDDWQSVYRERMLGALGTPSEEKILSLLNRLAQVRAAIPHNINPHLALEHVAL